MRRTSYWALYGTEAVARGFCKNCETYAFIIDGKYACCDTPTQALPKGYRRIFDVPLVRRAPKVADRDKILQEQEWRCLYCQRRFGARVYRKSREIVLRINWDHANPLCYSHDNSVHNFVAACQVCNRLKGASMFGSFDDARIELSQRWEAEGYTDVRPVRIILHRETSRGKILQRQMPSSELVPQNLSKGQDARRASNYDWEANGQRLLQFEPAE